MQLQEKVKVRTLELKNVLARLKNIAGLHNEPMELYDYLERLAKNHSELDILLNLFPFSADAKNDKLCILGHFDELHERISDGGHSFNEVVKEIVQEVFLGNAVIKIGVSRYNFFCLADIAKFCLDLKGNACIIQFPQFNVFPVDRLISNFIAYVNEIRNRVSNAGIDFVLVDNELIEILQLVQFHAQRGKISQKGLVRLFGIISEHAFIGPQTIVFDPFHKCNIKCKHCFVHNPLIYHQQEFLERKFDYEMFRRIIDDAADLKTEGIILQGDG